MPEIEITDDQREYLEDLRAELEEDVVYGHVRLTDALQFLIDSREGELSDDEESVSSATVDDADSAASDEDDAAAESDREDDQDDDAGDAEAGDVDDAVDKGIDDAEVDEGDGGGESNSGSDEDAVDRDAADEAEDDAEGDAGANAEPAAAPTPGGGDRLNAMMQLLDTHEDKWREGSGDARYEVDLPDGSTETANTKDDVRALLFKNY